jgi:hypothetical protein
MPAGLRSFNLSLAACAAGLMLAACVGSAAINPPVSNTATLTVAPTPTSPPATAVATPAGATPDRPFGPRTRDSGCQVQDALPDSACTPGAIFPDATADQICKPGYSSSVRNVPAEVSRMVYSAYGIAEHATGEYEVDHLVPLETGGSNDIANLWPQAAAPPPGFHEKDRVENYLHDQVCSGAMSLMDAQRAVATNWLEVYQRLPPAAPAPNVPTATSAPAVPVAPQPGASVQITSVTGASPGGRATVTASTSPGASCSITYTTPAGTRSTAQGLTPTSADANGTVTWTWDIGATTRPGTGSVVVNCAGGSARSPIQIE